MTLIRSLEPYKIKNRIITRETKRPVIFEGKEVVEIDLTETTAQKHFCGIRFKGSNEFYWIPHYRLNIKD